MIVNHLAPLHSPVSLSVLSVNLSISVNNCSVSISTQASLSPTESHSKLFGVDTFDQGDAVKLDGWLPLLEVFDGESFVLFGLSESSSGNGITARLLEH